MTIRPSSAFHSDYTAISELAKNSDEPIFIANKEDRETMFRHRDMIYAAEMSRLNGDPLCTKEELDARIAALFDTFQK